MDEKTEKIIKSHIIYSMTAGAIPIPLADIAAVTAIQIDMIKQIAERYSVNYDVNKGKSFASSLAGASFASVGASIVKLLPGVGTLVGIGTQVILSGASTYALGNIFEGHFSGGGTLSNFNIDGVKGQYAKLLKKGKKFAREVRKGIKEDDVFETIEKLKKLKESGAISNEEFEKTRKKLLDKLSNA